MTKPIFSLCLALSLGWSTLVAAPPQFNYVKITTPQGSCIVKLYNETPKHRDNFLKLAGEGFFDLTLFHRVIKEFMIQGGDPLSKIAKPGDPLGQGDIGYLVDPEFNVNLFHKRGALAAARNNNPEKKSSACQFYIVQGKKVGDEELNMLEQNTGRTIPAVQKEVYKTIGGVPFLDQNYTVFGEVVSGMEMVDKIASVAIGPNDRPTEDVRMSVKVLSKSEARKLEKELQKQTKR